MDASKLFILSELIPDRCGNCSPFSLSRVASPTSYRLTKIRFLRMGVDRSDLPFAAFCAEERAEFFAFTTRHELMSKNYISKQQQESSLCPNRPFYDMSFALFGVRRSALHMSQVWENGTRSSRATAIQRCWKFIQTE